VTIIASTRAAISLSDHLDELRPREERQSLPRVKHERNARGRELLHMRGHAVAAVGRNDAKRDSIDIRDMIQVRLIHRSGMKRRNLIVVEIGNDVSLSGVGPCDNTHRAGRDAERGQALDVVAAVVSNRRHHHGITAKTLEVIGDVACAAAPLTAHFGNLKRDRQNVRLLGKNVARKAIGKHRDGVNRERAADQRAWRHVRKVMTKEKREV
jgi:hypothetical protein